METIFTPWQSLAGGLLIGLASVGLMALNGRIMGATGILSGAIFGGADRWWRVALLAGMLCGPLLVLLITGDWPTIQVPVSNTMIIIGGILVGLGVTFGSGCTSGHGVCGMARLSLRSIVATITFMITCAATLYVLRHVIGL